MDNYKGWLIFLGIVDFFAVIIRMAYIGNERYGIPETSEEMIAHIPELAFTAAFEVLVANLLIAVVSIVVYIIWSRRR